MQADRKSFRKVGLTFEYGEDKIVDGVTMNEKCKSLAKKIKEMIDIKLSFADWLNNQVIHDQLKFDIKICLVKNRYPPQYSSEVLLLKTLRMRWNNA